MTDTHTFRRVYSCVLYIQAAVLVIEGIVFHDKEDKEEREVCWNYGQTKEATEKDAAATVCSYQYCLQLYMYTNTFAALY